MVCGINQLHSLASCYLAPPSCPSSSWISGRSALSASSPVLCNAGVFTPHPWRACVDPQPVAQPCACPDSFWFGCGTSTVDGGGPHQPVCTTHSPVPQPDPPCWWSDASSSLAPCSGPASGSSSSVSGFGFCVLVVRESFLGIALFGINQTVVVSRGDSGRCSRLPSRETQDRFGINTRL